MNKTLMLAALLALAGCDGTGSGPTTVEGAVVDKQTGAPIAGIEVTLAVFGGFGPATSVGSTLTDARGRFSVSTDFDQANGLILFVNENILGGVGAGDERYGGYSDSIPKGRSVRRTVKLIPIVPPGAADVSALPAGVYVYRLTAGARSAMRRFVVSD